MIAQIKSTIEFATVGQHPLPDLTNQGDTYFAHSVQDALEWLKAFPWYANAQVEAGIDGSYTVISPWLENSDPYRQIFESLADAALTRHRLWIRPVNTVYESAGYRVP